ncbi:putative T7SS-secreted protein [Streptomyces xiangluensis]|uniref:T7SS-secreted protein n=1 Tax=Streptomyces xiangluensis TaxID=2665720 RepID=A0ABV8YVB7_9ACTN
MAYREDVEFLEDSNPALIERSAAEFTRLRKLIDTTDDAFRKAGKVDWQSEGRDLYVKRLGEAKELTDALAEAFHTAGKALSSYADAVTTAKSHFESGQQTEGKLTEVMFREATAITPTRASRGASATVGGSAGHHGRTGLVRRGERRCGLHP